MTADPMLAIIGGSGMCRQDIFLVTDTAQPATENGPISGEISICAYTDTAGMPRKLAFLPRHGPNHHLAPHQVPYRANIAALKALGITQIIATCIAGSLRRRIRPGDLVIPDQFVNQTWGRDPQGPGQLIHLPMADPYCPRLRAISAQVAASTRMRVHRRGTVAVIQGPRFSTTAESNWLARQGWHLVNMTQYPEAYLAREAGICYSALAMITDYDVGVGGRRTGISFRSRAPAAPVLEVFQRNIAVLKSLLEQITRVVPLTGTCSCAQPLPLEYYKQPERTDVGTL
jgi:5'-methylthioadenosine phosphorylase